MLNTHQVHGEIKVVEGKLQQAAGKLTGNTTQQVKGLTKQVAGKVQKAIGDSREKLEQAKQATVIKLKAR